MALAKPLPLLGKKWDSRGGTFSHSTQGPFFIINLSPHLCWTRRLSEQFSVHEEGKPVIPKALCSRYILSPCPTGPQGQGSWLSFIHSSTQHLLVCLMSLSLCQALCWAGCGGPSAHLPGAPILVGSQSQVDLVILHWVYRNEMRPGALCPAEGWGGEWPVGWTSCSKYFSPSSSVSTSAKQA